MAPKNLQSARTKMEANTILRELTIIIGTIFHEPAQKRSEGIAKANGLGLRIRSQVNLHSCIASGVMRMAMPPAVQKNEVTLSCRL